MDENWYKKAIKNTLRIPHHTITKDGLIIKGCKRWETFIELAKMAQSLHQQELLQYSKYVMGRTIISISVVS